MPVYRVNKSDGAKALERKVLELEARNEFVTESFEATDDGTPQWVLITRKSKGPERRHE